MKKFECQDCSGVSYGSADLEYQANPTCIHCGSDKIKEVPDGQ